MSRRGTIRRVILELTQPRANWMAGLEVALTRPAGVAERRAGEDPWEPPPTDRPRRIADDLAWFRGAIDRPADNGLRQVDEALTSAWDASGDQQAVDRLQRLEQRGVLEAAGFALHPPDLASA
jgi:hypothetical protein